MPKSDKYSVGCQLGLLHQHTFDTLGLRTMSHITQVSFTKKYWLHCDEPKKENLVHSNNFPIQIFSFHASIYSNQ